MFIELLGEALAAGPHDHFELAPDQMASFDAVKKKRRRRQIKV